MDMVKKRNIGTRRSYLQGGEVAVPEVATTPEPALPATVVEQPPAASADEVPPPALEPVVPAASGDIKAIASTGEPAANMYRYGAMTVIIKDDELHIRQAQESDPADMVKLQLPAAGRVSLGGLDLNWTLFEPPAITDTVGDDQKGGPADGS